MNMYIKIVVFFAALSVQLTANETLIALVLKLNQLNPALECALLPTYEHTQLETYVTMGFVHDAYVRSIQVSLKNNLIKPEGHPILHETTLLETASNFNPLSKSKSIYVLFLGSKINAEIQHVQQLQHDDEYMTTYKLFLEEIDSCPNISFVIKDKAKQCLRALYKP